MKWCNTYTVKSVHREKMKNIASAIRENEELKQKLLELERKHEIKTVMFCFVCCIKWMCIKNVI